MILRHSPIRDEQEKELREFIRASCFRMDDMMRERILGMWGTGSDTFAIGKALDMHESVIARIVASRPMAKK